MAQPAPFLFDLDFSAPPEPEIEEVIEEIPPEPMITVAEHERLLAQIRQEAYEQGLLEAQTAREQTAQEKNADLQQAILNEISMVYTEVGTLLARLEKDASQLAFAFASRFAEKLVAQEPKAEIQALLHQVLSPLRETPHISIHLNPEIAQEIEQAAREQMEAIGFTGTLVIQADEAIMPGDCEVQWIDGGIGRNLRAAIRQAESLLEQHFAHIPDEEDSQEDDQENDQEEGAPGDEKESEASNEQALNSEEPQDQAAKANQQDEQDPNQDMMQEESQSPLSPSQSDMIPPHDQTMAPSSAAEDMTSPIPPAQPGTLAPSDPLAPERSNNAELFPGADSQGETR
ncbi:MAG: FliH/SctL family protein [Cohaesibacter sp.]|nr:FliH/SctL family protein [Cohaesibacter sp.]